MLLRIIGLLFLCGSVLLAGKMVFDTTIIAFWTTPWVIGNLFTLALFGGGAALLIIDEKEFGCRILALFGIFYSFASLLIYLAWSHAFIFVSDFNSIHISAAEYFGFLLLFVVTIAISASGTLNYIEEASEQKAKRVKILVIPSWGFAFANVAVVFSVIYKYVFYGARFYFWPFVGEILIVVIGAVVFLFAYFIVEDYSKILTNNSGRSAKGAHN